MPVGAQNINLPVGAQNINLAVGAQNTNLPVGAQNTNLPVGAQNTNLPVGAQNIDLPVEVQSIQLSIGAQNIESHDIEMSYVAQENNLPAEATNICQHNVSTNEENVCVIHCEQELQGLVLITNKEIPSYYYKIHTALTNTFIKCKYAFLILEGYVMALIKQEKWFYLFDPHARNCLGMPDPNGTAVVMQFANILDLEQYLYALSKALHSNLFKIVPVQFMEFVNKRTYSSQTMNVDKGVRLLKNTEAKKKKEVRGN